MRNGNTTKLPMGDSLLRGTVERLLHGHDKVAVTLTTRNQKPPQFRATNPCRISCKGDRCRAQVCEEAGHPPIGERSALADGRVSCLLTNLSTAPVPFARNPTRVRGTKLGRLLISRRESYRHLVVAVQ